MVPYLLEKGGGICQLSRQIMKIAGSKGVGMEEDIFLCTSLEVEEPTSYQEVIYSPNQKEWMDAMRDEMDSMARKRF